MWGSLVSLGANTESIYRGRDVRCAAEPLGAMESPYAGPVVKYLRPSGELRDGQRGLDRSPKPSQLPPKGGECGPGVRAVDALGPCLSTFNNDIRRGFSA